MAGTSEDYQGSPDARTIAIRPLSKGMHTNKTPSLLEQGAGLDIYGLSVEERGLRGLPGFKPLIESLDNHYGQIPFDYVGEHVDSKVVFYSSTGAQQMLCITNRSIYRSTDLLTFSRVPWTRVYTLGSISGNTITLEGAYALVDKLRAGHCVKLQRTATSEWETFVISNVVDATHVALTTVPSSAYNPAFYIYEDFGVSAPYFVQWVPVPGSIYFVDGSGNGIRSYAGTYLTRLATHNEIGSETDGHPAPFTGASAITYAGGRIIVGCVSVAGSEGRKTVYWSSASDFSEFSTVSYSTFANSAGEIIALKTLENYPIVFMATGIAAGTDYGLDSDDVDPWIFKTVETGGKNCCAPRGITSIPNALAFVAKTDICIISSLKRTSQGEFQVDSLDCPVLANSLNASTNKALSIAFYDSFADAVGFAFYTSSSVFTDIWYYWQKTKQWSHRGLMPYALTAIGDISVSASTTWAQMTTAAYTWLTVPQRSWRSYLSDYSVSHLTICDANGILYAADESRGYDTFVDGASYGTAAYPIAHVYETGDLDFGAPDDKKVVHDLALRYSGENTRATDVVLRIQVSDDKGRTWKQDRTITLGPLDDEEELHFRVSGVNLRFRISYTTNERPFTFEEFTLRVRMCGFQTVRGSD
jgi:hypothetical protein